MQFTSTVYCMRTTEALASFQAVRHRAANNSLLQPSLSGRLIGQPQFHSICFLLNLHIICFPVCRTGMKNSRGKGNIGNNK